MNPFPNKSLGNVGNETQVGAADRWKKTEGGVMRSGKRNDGERSTSVTVADHMPKPKLSAS